MLFSHSESCPSRRASRKGFAACAVAFALACAVVLASCAAQSESDQGYTLVNEGKLTVASDLATPPFEYVNESGQIEGFDYDLICAVADEMGLEINYLPAQKFDSIVPMVKQGVKTDISISSVTITDERKQEIDFADPYIDNNQGVVVLDSQTYPTAEDLNVSGVKIATLPSTTSEEWAQENLPNATIVDFDDWTAAFTATQSGQCQGIVCDLPLAQWMTANSFTSMSVVKEIPTGEQLGIAVSKDNPGLTSAINEALANLRESGKYDEIYDKWFGDSSADAAAGSDSSSTASTSEDAPESLEVSLATARSNESGGSSVLGGVATRLTWEATAGVDESISSVNLQLPDGGSFEDSTVTVTVLNGLDRTSVEAKGTISNSTMQVDFSEPIAAGSYFRIEVEGVVFPSVAGAYSVGGTYELTSGETKVLPESPTISISESTFVQGAVAWLDGQAWVSAWNSVPALNMFFKPQYIVTSIASLSQGWGTALLVTVIGFPLAIPIGLLFAFLKMSSSRVLRAIGVTYINVLRGTPLFLQIYIAFFGTPMLGLNLPSLPLGIAVLAVNCSAYLAEIFRAGIESIPSGQSEAAWSLGMNKVQTMFLVIIPQTVRRVIPTMTSEFVSLYKDTSLLSSVGVMELMMFSKNLTATTGNITPYVVAGLFYLVVTIPLIHVVTKVEKKMAKEERR